VKSSGIARLENAFFGVLFERFCCIFAAN